MFRCKFPVSDRFRRAAGLIALMMFSHLEVSEVRGASDLNLRSNQGLSFLKSLGIDEMSAIVGVTAMYDGDHKSVELFVSTSDEIVLGPIVLWLDAAHGKPVQVDSISSINRVLSNMQNEAYGITTRSLIDATMSLVRRQYLVIGGETGVPLFGTYRTRFLKQLAAKLPKDRVDRLKGILEERIPVVTEKTWNISWVEVDRLGGAERVVASGDVMPWKIRAVSREWLLDPGEIPAEVGVAVYRSLK